MTPSPFTIPPRDDSDGAPKPFIPTSAVPSVPAQPAVPTQAAPVAPVAPAVARPPVPFKQSPFAQRGPLVVPNAPDSAVPVVSAPSTPPAPAWNSAPAEPTQPEVPQFSSAAFNTVDDWSQATVQEPNPAFHTQAKPTQYAESSPLLQETQSTYEPQKVQQHALQTEDTPSNGWVALVPTMKDAFLRSTLITVAATFIYGFIRFQNMSIGEIVVTVLIIDAIILGIVFGIFKAQNRVKVNLSTNQIKVKGKTFNLSEIDYLMADFVMRAFGSQVKFVVGSGKQKATVTIRMIQSKKNVLPYNEVLVLREAVTRFNVPESFSAPMKGFGTHKKAIMGKMEAIQLIDSLLVPADAQ